MIKNWKNKSDELSASAPTPTPASRFIGKAGFTNETKTEKVETPTQRSPARKAAMMMMTMLMTMRMKTMMMTMLMRMTMVMAMVLLWEK